MATKKDLVEAYSFSRRRLVTAFVSGAPGGREVEPSRPGRTIVGGVALAILMVAGAAILGVLNQRTDVDWEQAGVISAKDTGADYIILAEGSPLRPLINVTSAMLLLGPDFTQLTVPDDEIATRTRGGLIGILGAPQVPPTTDSLVQSQWTACTGADATTKQSYGLQVNIAEDLQVKPIPDVGMVVRSGGNLYLLAEALGVGAGDTPRAYAYEVTDDDTADRVLADLTGGNSDNAIDVPPEFLALFPPGGALTLDSFGIPTRKFGRALPAKFRGSDNVPGKAKIGDYIDVNADIYVLTPAGALKLDDFSEGVYLNLGFPRGQGRPQRFRASVAPKIDIIDSRDLKDVVWPATLLSPMISNDYCALLDSKPGEQPGTRLATQPSETASAVDIAPGAIDREVEPGHGAVVQAGDFDALGATQPMLIDDQEKAFPLVGVAHDYLGYADEPDVVVPDAWVQLFNPGVPLSVDAARCPPTSDPQAKPCR